MTNEREPARWSDAPDPELPAELLAAFAHYGSSGPGAAVQARMGEQLARAVGHTAPRPWLRAWKVWLGGVLLLGAAWGGLRAARPSESQPVVAAAAPLPVPASTPVAVPVPSAEPVVEAPVAGGAESRPTIVQQPRRAAKRSRGAELRSEPNRSEPAALPAELALLVPARKLVAVDAARALALAEQHAREHARGAFSEEREVIAVEALVRLGRTGEARTRARSFAVLHPRSSHLAHLRELTGDE